MRVPRAAAVLLLLCALLAGCGSAGSSDPAPRTLAVGPTSWDVSAPAWYLHRVLHVGKRTVKTQGAGQAAVGCVGPHRGLLVRATLAGAVRSTALA